MPSSGHEIQSEYIVPRRLAVDAIHAIRELGEHIQPVLQVSEIRTIAGDRLWMSPEYNEDSVAIHFTWHPDPGGVAAAVTGVESALAAFQARPHWGKLFFIDASQVGRLYPRATDFAALVASMDPRGAFRNDWLTTHVLGERTNLWESDPPRLERLSTLP